jgi:iron complex outermembrane recepter protein
MTETKPLLRLVYSALAATALPAVAPVSAQQDGETDADNVAIQEIIVTAQKREQNLQDVPIVVTVVSEQLLQDTGVKDIKDLTILTPGLIVTSTTNESITTARIRGVGTVGDNAGLESSVGIVIDGVYRPRNGVGFGDLGELQRIEVLKGPQGTLFGKNTSAGVINIITQQPEFQFRANGEVGGGNFNALDAAASVTGPIVADKVAGRLFAARRKRDGFYDVSIANGPRTDTEDSDRDFYTVRGQLLFKPTDTLDIRFIADYSERDEICCTSTQLNTGPSAAIINALSPDSGVSIPANPFARNAFSNRPTPQDIEDRGVSMELNWDLNALGGSQLTSISAYRDWEVVSGVDADFSTADIWYRADDGRFGNEFKQASQELRLAGQADKLNWLVGTFYANEKLDSRSHLAFGTVFEPYYGLLFSGGTQPGFISALSGLAPGTAYPLNGGFFDTFDQKSDSFAIFTNNSYAFTESLEGTIGVRYTSEDKDLDSQYLNIGGGSAGCAALRANIARVSQFLAAAPPGTIGSFYGLGCGTAADPAFNNFASTQNISESETSGTAKLAYRFTPDVMAYASYARGYKAAGFNLDRERIVSALLGPADPASLADPDTSFPSETVDSYELGTKTTWLDQSLLVNATAFYQTFENFQLNVFTGISFVVSSIPEVTSQGVDVDFLWRTAGQRFSLQGGATYADTKYGNFTPGAGIPARLPNGQMSFAPKWSGSLSATYGQPIGDSFQWRANVGAKSTSHYNTGSDLNPAKEQDAFTILNARLGFGAANDRWMLEAWGQNLTDEDYYQVIIDAPLQPGVFDGFLGAPRTYGLTLRVSFD